MKLSFKSLVIIFLVALLGASIGTIATKELLYQEEPKEIYTTENFGVSTVEYSNIQPTELTQTIDKAMQTVVEINCKVYTTTFFGQAEGLSMGSGVIISSNGYIVTNNHVVETSTDIEVITFTGDKYKARVIGTDLRSDLAVIKIEEKNLPFTSFADSDVLLLGQQVVAIGNPLGEGLTCSEGIISALTKEVTIDNISMDLLQTTAAINQGNSGGGLFDCNANLVGVVNAKSSNSSLSQASVEGMGYAIPSNTAKKIVDDLIENGYVRHRATMGITVYKTNDYFYEDIKGCVISEVLTGGAADYAGIRAGDIIIKVDDKDIESYTDLTKALDSYSVGDEVSVTVNRNGTPRIYKVILQEATNY